MLVGWKEAPLIFEAGLFSFYYVLFFFSKTIKGLFFSKKEKIDFDFDLHISSLCLSHVNQYSERMSTFFTVFRFLKPL